VHSKSAGLFFRVSRPFHNAIALLARRIASRVRIGAGSSAGVDRRAFEASEPGSA
jgi:hypothetical protein